MSGIVGKEVSSSTVHALERYGRPGELLDWVYDAGIGAARLFSLELWECDTGAGTTGVRVGMAGFGVHSMSSWPSAVLGLASAGPRCADGGGNGGVGMYSE